MQCSLFGQHFSFSKIVSKLLTYEVRLKMPHVFSFWIKQNSHKSIWYQPALLTLVITIWLSIRQHVGYISNCAKVLKHITCGRSLNQCWTRSSLSLSCFPWSQRAANVLNLQDRKTCRIIYSVTNGDRNGRFSSNQKTSLQGDRVTKQPRLCALKSHFVLCI